MNPFRNGDAVLPIKLIAYGEHSISRQIYFVRDGPAIASVYIYLEGIENKSYDYNRFIKIPPSKLLKLVVK